MKQSYLVLGEQSNIAIASSAKVEACRNGAIDPERSRNRRRTWIQMRGMQKPSSPKPREKDDILQLASIKAKCTTGTECRFKANCSLKLPLAESCLWSAKKSVGSKVAFPLSRTNVEFPVRWSNWEFRSRNHCGSPGLMNQCRGFLLCRNPMLRFGVLPSVDVASEEWLLLHAEMLVSPNVTNEAA